MSYYRSSPALQNKHGDTINFREEGKNEKDQKAGHNGTNSLKTTRVVALGVTANGKAQPRVRRFNEKETAGNARSNGGYH